MITDREYFTVYRLIKSKLFGVVLISDGLERLDKFLARSLVEHSRSKLAKLVDDGQVLVNGRKEKASFLLRQGDTVDLAGLPLSEPHNLEPADIPLQVLFEDTEMMVVNKPRGLAAHPASSLKEPSLVNALLSRKSELSSIAGDFRPGIVHRLDKETSGLMVVAKNDRSHVNLARQIESKTAERRYFVLVSGSPANDRFVVDAPIGRNPSNRILMAVRTDGKRAVTHFKRLFNTEHGTLLGARLETGRTHQIRVHLSAIGLPVFGDRLYAPQQIREGELQLHAGFLEIAHPVSGERMKFFVAPDSSFRGFENLTGEHLDPF